MFGAAKSVLPGLGGMERTFDSTLDQFKCVADLLHSFQINCANLRSFWMYFRIVLTILGHSHSNQSKSTLYLAPLTHCFKVWFIVPLVSWVICVICSSLSLNEQFCHFKGRYN